MQARFYRLDHVAYETVINYTKSVLKAIGLENIKN